MLGTKQIDFNRNHSQNNCDQSQDDAFVMVDLNCDNDMFFEYSSAISHSCCYTRQKEKKHYAIYCTEINKLHSIQCAKN